MRRYDPAPSPFYPHLNEISYVSNFCLQFSQRILIPLKTSKTDRTSQFGSCGFQGPKMYFCLKWGKKIQTDFKPIKVIHVCNKHAIYSRLHIYCTYIDMQLCVLPCYRRRQCVAVFFSSKTVHLSQNVRAAGSHQPFVSLGFFNHCGLTLFMLVTLIFVPLPVFILPKHMFSGQQQLFLATGCFKRQNVVYCCYEVH